MSHARGSCGGPRPGALASVVLALASVATLAVAAGAQGGVGPGGGMGGRRGGGGFNMPGSNAPNVSKHFEELASLKDALKHVDSLTKIQKQSLSDIEHSYHKQFKSLGHSAQQMVDSAHADQEPPDEDRMDTLFKQAVQLRDQEFAAARDILTSKQQQNQFDQNVAQLHDKEAKREEDMEDRMDRMGGPGGMRGPMHEAS